MISVKHKVNRLIRVPRPLQHLRLSQPPHLSSLPGRHRARAWEAVSRTSAAVSRRSTSSSTSSSPASPTPTLAPPLSGHPPRLKTPAVIAVFAVIAVRLRGNVVHFYLVRIIRSGTLPRSQKIKTRVFRKKRVPSRSKRLIDIVGFRMHELFVRSQDDKNLQGN